MDAPELFEKELKKIKFPFYLRGEKQELAWKLAGLNSWLRGGYGFKDAFRNLLPHSENSDERRRLLKYVLGTLDEKFKSLGVYGRDGVSLFGQPFYPAIGGTPRGAWGFTMRTIGESIIFDQYRAKDFVKDDFVTIDAGANIGAFSVFAARLSPKGRVYCFEPDPDTFEILKKNTEPYPNITVFQNALGETEKSVDLLINDSAPAVDVLADSGMPGALGGDEHFSRRVKVDVFKIDGIVLKFAMDRVDFIKIDSEGYEKQIIIGARETIKRFSPVLSMSAYHFPKDKTDLPALVKSIDPSYKFRFHKEGEESVVFYK